MINIILIVAFFTAFNTLMVLTLVWKNDKIKEDIQNIEEYLEHEYIKLSDE